MWNGTKLMIAGGAALFVAGQALAAPVTYIDEDFESYANTGDMQGVWGAGGAGSLDTGFGNPGQSMAHPGGTVNSIALPNVTPSSAAEPFVVRGDIYDDGGSSNERVTIGVRDGASNIFEMGHYNGPSHYVYRVVLFGAGDVNWVAFNLVDDGGQAINNAAIEGWHSYEAIFTDTQVTINLDLNKDGNINGTAVVPISYNAGGFSELRLGGPSNLSSAGGGVNYDNVFAGIIPEPASLALLGLGGLVMFRRKRK